MRTSIRSSAARAGVATVLVAGVTALAACGGGSSDSGTTTSAEGSGSATSASSGDAGLQRAQAIVDQYGKAPTKIGITTPVGKPIPSGKTIAYVNCGAEACINQGKALNDAAAVLGWKVKTINSAPTPQAIQAAFTEAVRLKPDGVAYAGFPKAAAQRQLAQLRDAKIPVLMSLTADPVGDGIYLNYIGEREVTGAKILAAKMIADSKGEAQIGLANITGYPSIDVLTKAFKDEIAADCTKCSIKTVDIKQEEVGKDAPAKIASFLRANPKIKSVFMALDDFGIGLPAALRSAGLQDVKLYSWAPTRAGVSALQSGDREAAVPSIQREAGWTMADTFARLFTGGSVKPDVDQQYPWVLWSKELGTVPSSNDNPPAVADFEAQYRALWDK